jgi:1,4-dihydroxy-2-naphthoyl-CoA hydrolase
MPTDDHDRALLGDSAFDAHYGLELVECGAERVVGRLEVKPHLLQPTGIVHGGVYAAIAEALASSGTNWAVSPNGEVGLGMSNNTSFLRPAAEGAVLDAVALPVHSGRTTWVWDVTIAAGDGRPCAVSRVTIAVRPRRDP